jgi:hypothetical protein
MELARWATETLPAGGNKVDLTAHKLTAVHFFHGRPRYLDRLAILLVRSDACGRGVPTLVLTAACPAQHTKP